MSMNFAIGALETLVLNMSTRVWSVVSRVKGRDPLASEVINSILLYLVFHYITRMLGCYSKFSF